MSNAVYPTLLGLDIQVKWAPKFLNLTQQAVSGAEARIQLRQYPIYDITLMYEFLRSDSVNLELETLAGFFMQRSGSSDSFLWTHPEDNAVTAQQIGVGNGSATQFQLVRSYGGFVEPVMQPNAVTTITVGGTVVPTSLSAPAAPTLGSTAGGTLAATTYYVKVTYLDATGGETVASAESSLAVAVNNVLTVTSPATATGAVSYNVYVSTTAGTETKQNASPIAIGTGWTEPTSGLVAGTALPAGNTTGYSLGALGVITFAHAPPSSAAIAWTGTFYYRCRFAEDAVEFERFLSQFWDAKKVQLIGCLGSKIP